MSKTEKSNRVKKKSTCSKDSESLLISPSEALLLGLCLEEFLGYDREGVSPPRRRFIEILGSRLRPHLPSFGKVSTRVVNSDDLPSDIDWHTEAGNVGQSRSRSGVVFISYGDSETAVMEWDISRKSLLDWLLSKLWTHLSLTAAERFQYGPDAVKAAKGACEYFALSTTARAFESEGLDSAPQIQQVLESLAANNESEHVFMIGRQFGKLVHSIDDFESYVWNLQDQYELIVQEMRGDIFEQLKVQAETAAAVEFQEWATALVQKAGEAIAKNPGAAEGISKRFEVELSKERERIFEQHFERAERQADHWSPEEEIYLSKKVTVEETIQALLETDLVRHSIHAEMLLRDLLRYGKLPIFEASIGPELKQLLPGQLQTLTQVAHCRMAVWLAFGEVLGVLREADQEAQLKDASAATARSFQLQPADSPDNVHERLLKVESEFNADVNAIPEDVIARLGPTIEALAKRVWPADFMPNAGFRGELASILHGRLARGTDLDRRFASTAMALYKSYRVPSQHDLDNFHCSFEEARFFLAGVRSLVNLWKQIQDSNR